jgi:hypothetical protein
MLKEIAEHRGINLIQIESGDEYCKANGEEIYSNRSFIAGIDEIYLGIYDDPEEKIISFFHEVGHTLVPHRSLKKVKYDTYKCEALAWKYGIQLAKFYGIEFSKETKKKAKIQLETYRGYDEREVRK